MQLKVTVNGVAYDVEVEVEQESRPNLGTIFMGGGFVAQHAATPAPSGAGGGDGITAPLAGSVARILVEEGQEVASGDVVAVLEAMKMETEITASVGGTVAEILVAPGDAVAGGQVLVRLAD
jgi:methylmalonyl-CoA carboxyltransferase small subunit